MKILYLHENVIGKKYGEQNFIQDIKQIVQIKQNINVNPIN